MRAVTMRAFGPPEVLELHEVPDPTPGPGDALIEVEVVNITFVETQVRAGRPPHPAMSPALPTIPGNGVGGTVVRVGADGDPSLVGTRVVSSTGGSGAYAELVAVPADNVIPIPAALSIEPAVALLADGRTALSLMHGARVRAGETVLVEAAAGGVGSLLVQLALGAGARVVALAGGARKLALARELGAQLVADSSDPAWASGIEAELGGVDVVFDGVGGELGRASFELLREHGRFCPFGMASGAFADISEHTAAMRGVAIVRSAPLGPEELRSLSRTALELAATGQLRPVIGQTFALARAAEAHAAIESRATLGKTLLLV